MEDQVGEMEMRDQEEEEEEEEEEDDGGSELCYRPIWDSR